MDYFDVEFEVLSGWGNDTDEQTLADWKWDE